VPCIVRDGTFPIYVYSGDHPPPHCHVYWNGDKVALVELLSATVIAGNRLPKNGKALIRKNIATPRAAWNRLNS